MHKDICRSFVKYLAIDFVDILKSSVRFRKEALLCFLSIYQSQQSQSSTKSKIHHICGGKGKIEDILNYTSHIYQRIGRIRFQKVNIHL